MGVNRPSPFRPGIEVPKATEQHRLPRRVERPRQQLRERTQSAAQQPRDISRMRGHQTEQNTFGIDTGLRRETRHRDRKTFGIATALSVFAVFATTAGVTLVSRKMMASTEGLNTQSRDPIEVPVQPTVPTVVTLPPTALTVSVNTNPQPTEATASPTTQAPSTTEVQPTQAPTTIAVEVCAIPTDRANLNESHISAIQRGYFALNLYGEGEVESDHVDGIYGRNSRNAEDTFQANNGIDPSAEWNEDTRNALFGCQ